MTERLAALCVTAAVWLVGYACLRWLVPGRHDGALWLRIGYGFFVGWLLAAMALWLIALAGAGIRVAALLATAGLCVLGLAAWFRRPPHAVSRGDFSEWWRQAPAAARWALVVLLALTGAHLLMVGLEAWLRPLFAWDAWMHWAPKAKVWVETDRLAEFGPLSLAVSQDATYTIRNWQYPGFVPLVMTWAALASGGWHDIAAGLPWPAALAALLAAFYGQLRLDGRNPMVGVLAAWLLVSLPVVGTHAALPGYADLWMGAVFGLAVAALLAWGRHREVPQLVLALGLGAACAWIKLPGLIWMLMLVPPLLALLLPERWTLAALGAGAIALVLVWLAGGVDFRIPGLGRVVLDSREVGLPYVGHYGWGWQDVGSKLLAQLYVQPTWHLAAWLFPAALAVAIAGTRFGRTELAAVLVIALGLGFILFAFLLTERSGGVQEAQTTHRAFLHLAPALLAALLSLSPSRAAGHDGP